MHNYGGPWNTNLWTATSQQQKKQISNVLRAVELLSARGDSLLWDKHISAPNITIFAAMTLKF